MRLVSQTNTFLNVVDSCTIDKHCCSYMLMINAAVVLRHENSKLNLIFDKEDGTLKKKINVRTWRTLQAICVCPQICNWSTCMVPRNFIQLLKI